MPTDIPIGREAQTLPGVELLWSGRVPDHIADVLAQRNTLDSDETTRLAAFVRDADRDSYAVAHVMLRRSCWVSGWDRPPKR